MSVIFVRNSLNESIMIPFSVSMRQITDSSSRTGDPIWILEVGTTVFGKDGKFIPNEIVNLTDGDNINELLEKAVSNISSKINWGIIKKDTTSPVVTSCSIIDNSEVDINNDINIILEDKLPSSGINKNSIKLKVNGVEVTPEIIGSPYKYKVKYKPPIKYEQY